MSSDFLQRDTAAAVAVMIGRVADGLRFINRDCASLSGLARRALLAAACVFALINADAAAQSGVPITGDRLSGVVLPIEPLKADIQLRALKAAAWEVDDTRRLVLEGNVSIRIGGYSFTSDAAAVWINRIPSAEGLINQIAIYFDRVEEPAARAGFGVSGATLLVTASARGKVDLQATVLDHARPSTTAFLSRAEKRLADYLGRLLAGQPQLAPLPQIDRPPIAPPPALVPGGSIQPPPAAEPPHALYLPPPPDTTAPLFVPNGTISFSAGQIHIEPGPEENVISLTGSIVVQYVSNAESEQWSQLTLSAERGVIFTDPGSIQDLASGRMTAKSVRGIYLEGGVLISADEGRYVSRAPKIFFDVQRNQAIMVDGILRTHSRQMGLPVYARAEEMRQLAANQWEAKRVRVSTSEFFTPHLAIGAERMTVTQRPSDPADPKSEDETYIVSEGNTLRAGGVPFFYWPRFAGTAEDMPLRRLTLGTADNDGVRIETTWNLFSLLGVERPNWIETADLKLDGFTDRGFAAGFESTYRYDNSFGAVDLYGFFDEGVDRTNSGQDVDPEEELRGVALWEHQLRFDRYWTAQFQASYISDATFITARRPDDFEERRQYETSGYLKHQKNNTALTFLAQYDLNDFISNDWLLASQAYVVDRLPELAYRRYGDSILNAVTYSSETRYSRVRFRPVRRTPAELGVPGAAFGLGPDDEISDAFFASGAPSNYVHRFDTRHEVSLPGHWGIFDISPFVVGRLTGYDDDFENFSSDSDDLRAFGAAGLRVGTQFSRVDNSVENDLLDLHRLRHIIEPHMVLWYGYSTVDQSDLPTYDAAVESLATGAAVELAVRNTWQTQRGGPGRWRSVDVLTIDTSVVLDSSEADRESPIAQFFDYRPEYSQFGDHASGAAVWQLSDHLALTGMGVYDLEDGLLARGSIGASLRHSPSLTTYVEYRTIDASDSQLLDVEWLCRLTPKYEVGIRPQWDFNENDFRAIRLRLTRSFPDFDFIAQVEYDQIRDDTTFGASLGRVEF